MGFYKSKNGTSNKFDKRNYFSNKFNGGKPKDSLIGQTLRVVKLKKSLFPLFEEGDVLIETFPGSGYYVNFKFYQNLTLNIRDIMKIRDISFEDYFENLEVYSIEDLRDCPGLRQFYEICVKPTKNSLVEKKEGLKQALSDVEKELRVLKFYEGSSY